MINAIKSKKSTFGNISRMEDVLFPIKRINYWNSTPSATTGNRVGQGVGGELLELSSNSTVKLEQNDQFCTSDQNGEFPLSPFTDYEPLQNLVDLTPQHNSTCTSTKDCIHHHREKPELSDVLFSFKASPLPSMGLAVYPSPISPASYAQSQQLFQPNGYSPNYCLDQTFGPSSSTASGNGASNFPPQFPAMSVNVSMNMTMGYLPPPPEGTNLQHYHHQMQWAASSHSHGQLSTNQLSPNSLPTYGTSNPNQAHNHHYPQPYNATYSFAADFRPDSSVDSIRSHWIPSCANSSLLAVNCGGASTGTKIYHHSPNVVSPSKAHSQKALRSSENVSPSSTAHSFYLHTSPSSNGFVSKPNLCRMCGKTYARPSTLKTHLRTHSGEKPYRCIECCKSFSQAANLTAHARTHSGEKPFHCSICDRKFSQSSSVTTHMRTHSGEKPYRCRLCRKAFSDSSTLTKHLRIHSGEKPYQCRLCLLRFSQSGNLNRHMRVHSTSLSNNH